MQSSDKIESLSSWAYGIIGKETEFVENLRGINNKKNDSHELSLVLGMFFHERSNTLWEKLLQICLQTSYCKLGIIQGTPFVGFKICQTIHAEKYIWEILFSHYS